MINIFKRKWETIAFLNIYKIIGEKNRIFYRIELMNGKRLSTVAGCADILGLNGNSDVIDKTLQRTIQTMRDRGYIRFLGNYSGKYQLSNIGYELMLLTVEALKALARQEARGWN